MIRLTAGLKNSLIILEHLRSSEELEDIDISVGCFTNCREVGLTFAVETNKGYFTYCVYEHRNSDAIIINGKKGCISLNGDLPYTSDTKHDYLEGFHYNEHYKASEWLIKDILKRAKKEGLK